MTLRQRWRAITIAMWVLAVAAPVATAAPPTVTAPSAAVIEASTGVVLYAKNADEPRGMASTTKLMTALVALDRRPLNTLLTAAPYRPSPAETRLGLQPRERMTLADLVRAMMLPSANDAAQTVALRTGGTVPRFVDLMNERADAEGLARTSFSNPIGLDGPRHRSTARDLARLGVLAHENPFLRATMKRKSITLASGAGSRTIINRNSTLGTRLPGGGVIDGMKTGHTNAAGYALVGSATRAGVTVVSAVLGDPSEATRDADTIRLLRWATAHVERRTLLRQGAPVASVAVDRGKAKHVQLVAGSSVQRVVRRADRVEIRPIGVPRLVEAPVQAGARLGSARVLVGGRAVATVPLVTRTAVERESLPAAVLGAIGDHWRSGLLVLALLLGGTLTLLRARRMRQPARVRAAQAQPPRPERTPAP